MAGIAILLDLLRKNPSFTGQTLHSYGGFSAKLATSAAAASVAASYPFAARAFFGYAIYSLSLYYVLEFILCLCCILHDVIVCE